MRLTPRALACLALVLALAAGVTPASAATGDPSARAAIGNDLRRQQLLHRSWPDDGVPGSLLVTAATPAAAAAVAEREGGVHLGGRAVLVKVEPGTEAASAARITNRGGVIDVEPDRERALARRPNDPGYRDQWPHVVTSAESAWERTIGSREVRVAVLDTGIDARHPDLRDNIAEQLDLSSGRVRSVPVGTNNDACGVGHGTFVAGIIGAVGDNGTGLAGVAWEVSIVDVALTSRGSRCGILDSAIILALEEVSDPERGGGRVDIVNLSLGGLASACPTALQAALDTARSRGTLVVAAAGNEQEAVASPVSIPASCNGVLSVGAVGRERQIAPYSNANPYVDLVAPGGDSTSPSGLGVVSTLPGSRYGMLEGTSFAAPYVAGVAALLRSIDPTFTPDELESILERNTDRSPAPRDDQYGWGIVDANRAVQAALAGRPPSPRPDPPFPVRAGTAVVERVRPSGSTTEAIRQAVAMSEFTFADGQAFHAVLARSDDFADALAGSALGFGLGPLLFSTATGALAGPTRVELQRVLPPGSTVYLLGGSAALPPSLDSEVAALGYTPVRLAGVSRQLTAVAVAEELERSLADNGFQPLPVAIVATAFNWPDAVAAGALGAWFGMPILVTTATALDEPVRSFLAARTWDRVYVVGGTAAIAESVRAAVRDAARLTSADTVRLAGTTRHGTTVAISEEFERFFAQLSEAVFGEPLVPNVVAAVNLRRDDGFAHVLSASSLLGAFAGVFAPVEGENGTHVAAEAEAYLCRFPAAPVAVGGTDIVSDAAAERLAALMGGGDPACRS